jgi:hypothetical protein
MKIRKGYKILRVDGDRLVSATVTDETAEVEYKPNVAAYPKDGCGPLRFFQKRVLSIQTRRILALSRPEWAFIICRCLANPARLKEVKGVWYYKNGKRDSPIYKRIGELPNGSGLALSITVLDEVVRIKRVSGKRKEQEEKRHEFNRWLLKEYRNFKINYLKTKKKFYFQLFQKYLIDKYGMKRSRQWAYSRIKSAINYESHNKD